jgi:hypothetical protein
MKRLVCIATAAAASAAAVVLLGAGPEAPAAAGGPDTTPPAGASPASVSGVPTDFDTRAVPDGSHRPIRYVHLLKLKVAKKGRLRVGPRLRTGRTILFRYHGPYAELAKAKLRLAVPPASRRPPWGPR